MMNSLVESLRNRPALQSTTVRNLSYLMTAEGITRVVRITLTIAMARLLSVTDFGVLAVALTIHELVSVLVHNGFGLALLRENYKRVNATANTAYLLSFGWAIAMCCIQLLAAWIMIGWGFEQSAHLVQALAPVHLLLPFALTHVQMIHRKGELSSFATVGTVQNICDCLITFILLLAGLGLWSVVVARFLSTVVWVVGFRRVDCWRFSPEYGYQSVGKLFLYTLPVLLSEYSKSIRQWGDNLIVGALLGTELLGLYYFAKNSGLGISLSLGQISIAAVTPRLAELTRSQSINRQSERKRLIGRFSLFLTVMIGCQALLAPLYVPVLFGSTWEPAVPLLALMCVSAIPRAVADLHACLARNSGLTALEATWNSAYTLIFLLGISLAAGFGLEIMAGVLIVLNLVMSGIIVGVCWRSLADDDIGYSRTPSADAPA